MALIITFKLCYVYWCCNALILLHPQYSRARLYQRYNPHGGQYECRSWRWAGVDCRVGSGYFWIKSWYSESAKREHSNHTIPIVAALSVPIETSVYVRRAMLKVNLEAVPWASEPQSRKAGPGPLSTARLVSYSTEDVYKEVEMSGFLVSSNTHSNTSIQRQCPLETSTLWSPSPRSTGLCPRRSLPSSSSLSRSSNLTVVTGGSMEPITRRTRIQ